MMKRNETGLNGLRTRPVTADDLADLYAEDHDEIDLTDTRAVCVEEAFGWLP